VRKYSTTARFLEVPILLAFFSMAAAQLGKQSGSTGPLKAAPTNLSGFWLVHPSAGASAYSSLHFQKDVPPMTAWGEEKFKATKPAFGPLKTTPQQSNDPVYGLLPAWSAADLYSSEADRDCAVAG